MQQRFFIKPFATAGDRDIVPNDTQATGDVSYEQGYGYDYQRDQTIDPLAKPIERSKHNALLHDITEALQQYQMFGIPEWISQAENGSKAYPYARRTRVRYRTSKTGPWEVYESLVDNNTAAPNDTTQWAIVTTIVASQEQALAGTDNGTIMTPLRVAQATANKQPTLGYTPVQQGTGIGQQANIVKIGWSKQSRLKATVDNVDQGNFVFDSQLTSYASIDYVDKHYLKPDDADRLYLKPEDADNRYLTPEQGDKRYWTREKPLFPDLQTGYQILPSGLILQWGLVEKPPHGRGVNVKYPVTFPHAVFAVYATNVGRPASGIQSINVVVKGTEEFQMYCDYHGDHPPPIDSFWLALGY